MYYFSNGMCEYWRVKLQHVFHRSVNVTPPSTPISPAAPKQFLAGAAAEDVENIGRRSRRAAANGRGQPATRRGRGGR